MPMGQPMPLMVDPDATKKWCGVVLEDGISSLISADALKEWKQADQDVKLVTLDSSSNWSGESYGQTFSVFGKNIQGIGTIDGTNKLNNFLLQPSC